MKKLVWSALLFSAFPACTCNDGNEPLMMPKPPPPESVDVPASLSIAVEVDGKPHAPIDKKLLDQNKPHFQDAERRAWSIGELFGPELSKRDLTITVIGDQSLEITMQRPAAKRELEPVLILSRRGEVSAAMISPKDPFPAFHGQGRRLERGGDPMPRVSGQVTKIRVTVAAETGGGGSGDGERADERAQVTDVEPLEIVVDGKKGTTWSYEQLSALAVKRAEETGVTRDTWSMRDAAKQLVGPKARVVAVVAADGKRMEITKAEWLDAAKTPAMRVNRQGRFKFQWSGVNLIDSGASELRNVRVVEIVSDR